MAPRNESLASTRVWTRRQPARRAPADNLIVGGLRLRGRWLWRGRARERPFNDGGSDRRVDDQRSDHIRTLSNAEDGRAGRERLAAIRRRGRVAGRLFGGGVAFAVIHARVARICRCGVVHRACGIDARHAEVEHRHGEQQGDESTDHAYESKRSRVERKCASEVSARTDCIRAPPLALRDLHDIRLRPRRGGAFRPDGVEALGVLPRGQ